MNATLKKILVSLLLFSISLSLYACGRSSGDGDGPDAQVGGEVMWVSQTREVYPFEPGYIVRGIARLGNALLVSGIKSGDPILGLMEFDVQADGAVTLSETQTLALDEPGAADEARIHGVTAGGDGYFYVLTGELPAFYRKNGERQTNDDYQGRYSILKYAPDGAFVDRLKITDWHGDDICGIAVGNDGEVVIRGNSYEDGASHLSLIHWDAGRVIDRTFSGEEGYVQSLVRCGKGVVVSMAGLSETKGHYYLIDGDTGALSELEISDTSGADIMANESVSQGLEDEYIQVTDSSFVALDFDAGAYEELYRWNYEEFYENDCEYVSRIAEQTFVYAVEGGESLFITGRVAQPYQERSVVNVAVYGMEDAGISGSLAALNAAGGEYQYEMERYAADETDRLLAAISSDNAPDLVLFRSNLDTGSEYFEDLYPYIDSDPELSREDFLPNLLEALSVDGQLHELWTGVEIRTLAARAADVGDGRGLTPSDYDRILQENADYRAVFQSFMSKENLLQFVADIGISVYIDKDSGTCSFDSESFAEILSWCGDMGNEIVEGSGNAVTYDMSQVVLSFETISDPERLKFIYENFGEPFVFTGFPLGENGGHCYVCAEGGGMAIPTRADNKEGAWAFIRSRLVESAQQKLLYQLPVNDAAFRRQAASKLNDEAYALLIDLAEDTRAAKTYAGEPLREIILSCGMDYLAGNKSLEEAAALIQNRASLYMSERYG